MKIVRLFFLSLILLNFSCASEAQKINGLSVVASRDSITKEDIRSIVNVHANYVSLMPFAYTRDLTSPKITYKYEGQWFGERDIGVIQYGTEFQKKGLKIMVKPQLWISRGQYTGYLEMDTEEDWRILEETYREFILAYAKTAEKIKADLFCIGTELDKFVSHRPQYWKHLIAEIREVYKGKLTYAANWDEFKRVSFWDQIDYIGIDAYFPISETKTPTVQEFEKGWQPHKKIIKEIQSKFKRPVLFTEFGYRSVDYTGKEPWNSDRIQDAINLEAQSNGLQAIYNQFWNEDWFAGGFVWKWFHRHDRVGGQNNNRFTPQNKPAEQLLRNLYRKKTSSN